MFEFFSLCLYPPFSFKIKVFLFLYVNVCLRPAASEGGLVFASCLGRGFCLAVGEEHTLGQC